MTELPGTPWRELPWTVAEALTVAPMQLDWRGAGQVRHGFTHFELIIDVLAGHVPRIDVPEGFALGLDALDDAALPSVMRKCVRIAGNGKA
jgi:A/G-specific adenine glycosylase